MERGIVADIVVVNSLSVLKLLAAKDDALLLRWDSLLCDARKKKSKRANKSNGKRDIVCLLSWLAAWTRISIHQNSNQISCARRQLTLGNLGLDVLDRFTLLHFDRNGLAGEGLDEELLRAST